MNHFQYCSKVLPIHCRQPGGYAIGYAIIAEGLLSKIIELFECLSVPYKELAQDILRRQPPISYTLPPDPRECIRMERYHRDVLQMIVPELPYRSKGFAKTKQHILELITNIVAIISAVPECGPFDKDRWNRLRQHPTVLLLELQLAELSREEPFLSDSRHDGARMEECSRSYADCEGLTPDQKHPIIHLFDICDDDYEDEMEVDDAEVEPIVREGIIDPKFSVWSLHEPNLGFEPQHPFDVVSLQQDYQKLNTLARASHDRFVKNPSLPLLSPLGFPPPTLNTVRAVMRDSAGRSQTKVEQMTIRRFLASQVNRELHLEMDRELAEGRNAHGSLTEAVNVLRRSLDPAEAEAAGDTQLDVLAATARWEGFINQYLENMTVDPAHLV
ncbi:hypothetical protein WG66_014247 [Moniliophthora roreri]|uniref:Uncharacterized protein n=1 Tax=Moniliophthora roreri TaxID=221103 RepID=A0A0W0FVH8_MONRR|nr:hypothetical protein WG66_014247 [Moniliophthora roreri]